MSSVTPDAPTKQPAAAASSQLAHSVGSAKSSAVSTISNSDRQRLGGEFTTSSVEVIPQAASCAGAVETASTSEVSYSL